MFTKITLVFIKTVRNCTEKRIIHGSKNQCMIAESRCNVWIPKNIVVNRHIFSHETDVAIIAEVLVAAANF